MVKRKMSFIDFPVGTRPSTGCFISFFLWTKNVNLGLFITEKRKHINMLFYFFIRLSRKWTIIDGTWRGEE